MTAIVVRKYLTQDFSIEDKKSYSEYIKGNTTSTDWIEKANIRREPLLTLELQCINNGDCGDWVNIKENGICECSKGHECYDVVLKAIENIII